MVPWNPQHDSDSLCFPASLWMVVRYFLDHAGFEAARESLAPCSYSEIVEWCGAGRENGTRLSQELMSSLTAHLKGVTLSMRTGFSLAEAQKRAVKGLPTILIYDGSYVLQRVRGSAHAGVFIGSTANGDPILNNPWVGALFAPDRRHFSDGWELRSNRAVLVDPLAQTTLGEKA